MRIADQIRAAKVQAAVRVKQRVLHVDVLNGAEEQLVRAERKALLNAAAEKRGRFVQRGRGEAVNLARVQAHLPEFIDVPPAFHAAEICRAAERMVDQVQAEYAGLHNLRIRVARRTQGDADHRRRAVDYARPRDGNQVVFVKARLGAPAGKHHRRNRGKEGGRADGAEMVWHIFPPWKELEKTRRNTNRVFFIIHGKKRKINKKFPPNGKKWRRLFVLYAKAASRLCRLHKEMKRGKMEPRLEGIFHHGGNQDGSK